jgi:adenylate kinase
MYLVMLGGPGAGKGTASDDLAKKYNIPHVSTGDMLREEVAKGSELGLEVKQIMAEGKLVSDDLVKRLVENKLQSEECINGIILDGYPRNSEQAKTLDEIFESIGKKLDATIEIDVPDEVIIDRISNRVLCSNKACGAIYNLKNVKPQVEGKCDKCGADLYQRADDNAESVKKRLEIYHEEVAGIVEYYRQKGILHTLHSTAETQPADTFNKIVDILDNL